MSPTQAVRAYNILLWLGCWLRCKGEMCWWKTTSGENGICFTYQGHTCACMNNFMLHSHIYKQILPQSHLSEASVTSDFTRTTGKSLKVSWISAPHFKSNCGGLNYYETRQGMLSFHNITDYIRLLQFCYLQFMNFCRQYSLTHKDLFYQTVTAHVYNMSYHIYIYPFLFILFIQLYSLFCTLQLFGLAQLHFVVSILVLNGIKGDLQLIHVFSIKLRFILCNEGDNWQLFL